MFQKNRKTEYKSVLRRLLPGACILSAALVFVCILAVMVGPVRISAKEVTSVSIAHFTGAKADVPPELETIIWNIRLPRALLAAIVGMLLASAGAALQALLLNPLADPYTVGVSSGAALGASIAILAGVQGIVFGFGVPVTAFLFAMLTMFAVYGLARSGGRVSPHTFLLAGVVVGAFLWAMLTFIMTIAQQDLATIINWLLGSFAVADPWKYVLMSFPFAAVGLAILMAFSRDLNIYSMGEETAAHLGIDTETLKTLLIAVASLITAAAVSVCGIIGFVGLMVPHIARKVFGPDHRVLIPMAALFGGVLMVSADIVARLIVSPSELPVGVITALLGAPFFFYLLKRGAE